MDRPAAYTVKQGGKRVRARLCLRLCRAWQVAEAEAVTLAAAVELLHNTSLVIDDLQDGDLMRLGEASVWRVFGDAQAMNLSLFLLAQAQAVAICIRSGGPGLGPLFTSTLRDASVGQSLEIGFRRGSVPDTGTYAEIARLKTGSFFRLCAEGAATLARLPADLVTRTGETFGKLGLLYQMQDDLADTLGLKGREFPGADLAEGKINAVSLLFLERELKCRMTLPTRWVSKDGNSQGLTSPRGRSTRSASSSWSANRRSAPPLRTFSLIPRSGPARQPAKSGWRASLHPALWGRRGKGCAPRAINSSPVHGICPVRWLRNSRDC
ncbi:MAG: polyprenyl synthetase family protein [Opitutales bacterium]|nr:polyprenyl synthetase family protein [Opitutales bacterium]